MEKLVALYSGLYGNLDLFLSLDSYKNVLALKSHEPFVTLVRRVEFEASMITSFGLMLLLKKYDVMFG
jgi:hypothetical protein